MADTSALEPLVVDALDLGERNEEKLDKLGLSVNDLWVNQRMGDDAVWLMPSAVAVAQQVYDRIYADAEEAELYRIARDPEWPGQIEISLRAEKECRQQADEAYREFLGMVVRDVAVTIAGEISLDELKKRLETSYIFAELVEHKFTDGSTFPAYKWEADFAERDDS